MTFTRLPLRPLALALLVLSLASVVRAAPGPVTTPVPRSTAPAAASAHDKQYEQALVAALDRAFPGEFGFAQGGMAPPGDAALLADTLASPAFLHAAVGPLDLYVLKADGLTSPAVAQRTLDSAAAGLAPLGKLLAQRFPRATGLVSGQRFPILLASSDVSKKQGGFDQLVALVDWCGGGGDGWIADNGTLWTDAQRAAPAVRTWTIQVLNLAHPDAAAQAEAFLAHGLGYFEIAHVVHRLLRLGSWGLVPPWFAQGLTDELDIEAYGEAWVGGDWYVTETAGWFRPGWSGFVPEGQSPPAPVTGPPADLAVTVSKTGDSWQHRANSPTRHWDNLVADLDCPAPASFRFTAEHESFLPRDRADARCLFWLLLEVVPQDGEALLAALDVVPTREPNGMFSTDPLPEVFARALGGLPSVDALARQPLGEKLSGLDHEALVRRFEALGAGGVLRVADHRDAGAWLYDHAEFAPDVRGELFNLILTAEFVEQQREWLLVSEDLDVAMHAALSASKVFPKTPAERARVAAAFSGALKGEVPVPEAPAKLAPSKGAPAKSAPPKSAPAKPATNGGKASGTRSPGNHAQ